jgi:transposase-like protein
MAVSKKDISIFEFLRQFGTNEACRDYLKSVRWPDKPICPYCGHDRSYVIEGGKRYKCASNKCYSKFSITVKTVFEDTNLPLQIWFLLIYMMASNRKSISSRQISRNLGVPQKTAWNIMHKLRLVFEEKYIEPLSGTVEVDECFIGGGSQWTRWGSISTRKSPIVGMLQRGGRVIIKAVENRMQNTLHKIVVQFVQPGATVYTDGWLGYNGLKKNYNHEKVNHSLGEYVRGDVHTNGIENVWGYFKKNIRAGHHYISAKHVQRYCNEVAWKFNNRHLSTMEKFNQLLKRCLESKQLVIEFKKVRSAVAA